MRILITNDDGIEAPGLDLLEHITSAISKDIWVVAPETDQSAAPRIRSRLPSPYACGSLLSAAMR